MSNYKRVLKHLNKEELASQKVELALIDDLDKQFKKINSSKDELTKEGNRIGKLIFGFRDVLNNYKTIIFINLLSDYEKAAKDLGIKIDTKYQKAFDDYLSEKNKQRKRFGI